MKTKIKIYYQNIAQWCTSLISFVVSLRKKLHHEFYFITRVVKVLPPTMFNFCVARVFHLLFGLPKFCLQKFIIA